MQQQKQVSLNFLVKSMFLFLIDLWFLQTQAFSAVTRRPFFNRRPTTCLQIYKWATREQLRTGLGAELGVPKWKSLNKSRVLESGGSPSEQVWTDWGFLGPNNEVKVRGRSTCFLFSWITKPHGDVNRLTNRHDWKHYHSALYWLR